MDAESFLHEETPRVASSDRPGSDIRNHTGPPLHADHPMFSIFRDFYSTRLTLSLTTGFSLDNAKDRFVLKSSQAPGGNLTVSRYVKCLCVYVRWWGVDQFIEQSSPSVSVSVSEQAVSMATWVGLTMTALLCSSSALALLSCVRSMCWMA